MKRRDRPEILYVRTEPLNIQYIPFRDLLPQAIQYHNKAAILHGNYHAVVAGRMPRKYLQCIVINHVRHNLTNYEDILKEMSKMEYSKKDIFYAKEP